MDAGSYLRVDGMTFTQTCPAGVTPTSPLLYWNESIAEPRSKTDALRHALPALPCFDHTALVADAVVAHAITLSVPIVLPYI